MNLRPALELLSRCTFSAVTVVYRSAAANRRHFQTASHSLRATFNASLFPLPTTKAKIIDGKAIARTIEKEVSEEISALLADGRKRPPHLTALIVGDDPASHTYVANKIKACDRSGITSDTIRLPASISEEALLRKVALLNDDEGSMGSWFNCQCHPTWMKLGSVMPFIHRRTLMGSTYSTWVVFMEIEVR